MIPSLTKQTIDNYVNHRLKPGGFMTAVLSNDLTNAVGRADLDNRSALPDIVTYLYNNVPANCWGSPEKVDAWLNTNKD